MDDRDDATKEFVALRAAYEAFALRYPGAREGRQPVHTLYGGAHLFKADTVPKLGQLALRAFDTYASDPLEWAAELGLDAPEATARAVHRRVRDKLRREPVEDFRIDFEDGFGFRPNAEEDEFAGAAARELARAFGTSSASPFVGIRIKPFNAECVSRAARTLELFLESLVAATGGAVPPRFLVTLPKVTVPAQPRALAALLGRLERKFALAPGTLRIELMIEAAQALLGFDGRSPLGELAEACDGRCVGAHLGTYDFTASCDITASHQSMGHPLCDLARGMMTLAYAGRPIALSDGATNVLPLGPHEGTLTDESARENRVVVYRAWRIAYNHIRHSMRCGFYQGWDLHPAQLPVRYAATFAFFLEGQARAADRLRQFVDKAGQATRVAEVFDDAATGQGLLNFFLRALNCGAIDVDDLGATGLTADEIATRSFAKILEGRLAVSAR